MNKTETIEPDHSDTDIAIRAEGLGKSYLIGHQSVARERYGMLSEALMRGVKRFAKSAGDIAKGRQLIAGDEIEEFWALRDVSFTIRSGEVVGIIGRNGAGKSTLLKVLSRITEPSVGRATVRGRVASLLEVGTGFHPELTGRENVLLNGAILGMRRAEIRAKFDEIVSFAEIEKFLDTPVKRYSSGMYVRLAFAVAAHLEPEILVVDEVLAVGDAEFQRKCLGKMDDVAKHGRTVIFVSHQMSAIERLCPRCIFMQDGQVAFDGDTMSAIGRYSNAFSESSEKAPLHSRYVRSFEITPESPVSGEPCELTLTLKEILPDDPFHINVAVHALEGGPIFGLDSRNFSSESRKISAKEKGFGTIVCKIPCLPLLPGRYSINFAVVPEFGSYEHFPNVVQMQVNPPSGLRNFDHICASSMRVLAPSMWTFV